MPFILGPVNLLFDCAIVLPCYAVCAFFLMTIQQYLRISIDELTTVNNRNELNSYLDNLMLLPEKDRRSTFMMFIDLNKFKHINDNMLQIYTNQTIITGLTMQNVQPACLSCAP